MIFLNIQQFLIEANRCDMIAYLEQEVLDELREEYAEFLKKKDMGLAAALRRIFAKAKICSNST